MVLLFHFRTIITNSRNFSHARFLPRYFIFTDMHNINVFKMLSVMLKRYDPLTYGSLIVK
jgi:hypothetical protein